MSGQASHPKRSIVTSLRLTPQQHEALRGLAAREHRSVAQQLRHIIEERVAESEYQLLRARARGSAVPTPLGCVWRP